MNKITKIAATILLSAIIIGLSTFTPTTKSGSLKLGNIHTDKSETFHINFMAVGGWYVEQVSPVDLASLKF